MGAGSGHGTHGEGQRRRSPAAAGSPRTAPRRRGQTRPLRATLPWGRGAQSWHRGPAPCPGRGGSGGGRYLAQRSSLRASGAWASRRQPWIRSRASARCSSTGVSEAASKGTTSSGRGTSSWGRDSESPRAPTDTPGVAEGPDPSPTCRQAWSCGASPAHSSSSSAALGGCGARAAGARGFFFLRTRLLWDWGEREKSGGAPTPPLAPPGAASAHLHHEPCAAAAEALQHAQEEVRRLHQVPQEGARLLGLVKLAEQSEEELAVLRQVEDVVWKITEEGDQRVLGRGCSCSGASWTRRTHS